MEKVKVEQFEVWCHNREELLELKKEVFTQDTYYFETDTPTPRIIDAGAYVGLSTLYFKKLYPQAIITAIEPNPVSFKLLEKNIHENFLYDVTTINAALADFSKDNVPFYTDETGEWQSTSSFLYGAWNNQQTSKKLLVKTMTLSSLLTEKIDLLKLDIEGAEMQVLQEAHEQLQLVKRIILEFHPHPDQSIVKLVEFLERAGFIIEILKRERKVELKDATGLVIIEGVRLRR